MERNVYVSTWLLSFRCDCKNTQNIWNWTCSVTNFFSLFQILNLWETGGGNLEYILTLNWAPVPLLLINTYFPFTLNDQYLESLTNCKCDAVFLNDYYLLLLLLLFTIISLFIIKIKFYFIYFTDPYFLKCLVYE